MEKLTVHLKAVSLAFSLFSAMGLFAQTNIVMQADAGKEKINKSIYGRFAEHLGHCIYEGFYVGDTSTISNSNGVRNDIIDVKLQDYNSFDEPDKIRPVTFKNFKLTGSNLSVTLPLFSVVVLELK